MNAKELATRKSTSGMHALKKARLDLGYTQTMLADFAQVSVPTIKRAEAGKPLRPDIVQLICQYFSSRYHREIEPRELGLVYEEKMKRPSQQNEDKSLPFVTNTQVPGIENFTSKIAIASQVSASNWRRAH